MALGQAKPLTELNTRNLPGDKRWLANKADKSPSPLNQLSRKCGSLNIETLLALKTCYSIKSEQKIKMITYYIHKCFQTTPYLGKRLDGRVIYTILRGQTVYQNGKFSPPLGQLVLSPASQS
jgi:hypothetical protein